jgi:peptidoglycan/xylan/chitin deacetylase (PgdA/CDA1 family)
MSAKVALRNLTAGILFGAGITAPEWRARRALSIVTMHRVLPESERRDYPYPSLAVTPEELDEYLTYFSQHFECGTLASQCDRYLAERASARPLLALTFDDGQYDNYLHARPVLERHRVKASFFVPVEAVERQELLWHDRLGFAIRSLLASAPEGPRSLSRALSGAGLTGNGPGSLVQNVARESKRLAADARLRLVGALEDAAGAALAPDYARLMTFDEIAELAADGHEIGSHGMTHRMLPECDDESLKYEVERSRQAIQERLGRPIESFCYPNGDSDARSARAVAAAGYRRAVTTAWGRNGEQADPFRLRRFDMVSAHVKDRTGGFAPAVLAFRMSGWYPGLR